MFPHPVSVSASKTKQTLVNHKEAFDTGPENVGDKMLQPFLIFKTKYGAVLLKIHWIRIRKWWYSTKDRVTSWKRSSWICRLWSSAFGSELNFHDDTLAAANESQNISETSNSDQNLSSASTKKTNLRKKMKGFLKNRPNKKFKGSYEKNKKLEHQRSKSFWKN